MAYAHKAVIWAVAGSCLLVAVYALMQRRKSQSMSADADSISSGE